MFQLCRELKIDDPPAWFNAVGDTTLIDWWLAFYMLENDRKNNRDGEMVSPGEAGRRLGKQ